MSEKATRWEFGDTEWMKDAACLGAEPFINLEVHSKRGQALEDEKAVKFAAVCATCVVLVPCRKQIEGTKPSQRGEGAVLGGYFIGKYGKLFEMLANPPEEA